MSQLKYSDRVIIEEDYRRGLKPIQIATKLNVSIATIYREFERGYTGKLDKTFQREYSAELGQKTYMENKRKCGRKAKA